MDDATGVRSVADSPLHLTSHMGYTSSSLAELLDVRAGPMDIWPAVRTSASLSDDDTPEPLPLESPRARADPAPPTTWRQKGVQLPEALGGQPNGKKKARKGAKKAKTKKKRPAAPDAASTTVPPQVPHDVYVKPKAAGTRTRRRHPVETASTRARIEEALEAQCRDVDRDASVLRHYKRKTGYQLYHMHRVAELKEGVKAGIKHHDAFKQAARDWSSMTEDERIMFNELSERQPGSVLTGSSSSVGSGGAARDAAEGAAMAAGVATRNSIQPVPVDCGTDSSGLQPASKWLKVSVDDQYEDDGDDDDDDDDHGADDDDDVRVPLLAPVVLRLDVPLHFFPYAEDRPECGHCKGDPAVQCLFCL